MATANRQTERDDPEPGGPSSRPSHQEIAERAYLLWLDRGCRGDADLDNWRDAERQLVEERESEMLANLLQRPDRRLVVGPDLASK